VVIEARVFHRPIAVQDGLGAENDR
jgi:hypothetical protein